MIRKISIALVMVFGALTLSGCAQMIADSLYGDKYAKPATVSAQIRASSKKAAVGAAVSASGKTGWIPKTISVESGYMLAERVPDAKFSRGVRDYTYRLEVRVPDSGSGAVSVTVTPPTGVLGKPSDEIANEFLTALATELKTDTSDVRDSTTTSSNAAAKLSKAEARSEQMTTLDVQKNLVELGYLRGKADGIMGKNTIAALKKFQEKSGMPVTGKPDDETVRQLRISTSK